MEKNKLSQRFINGLKKYDLTIEEIRNSDWIYGGGNKRWHDNYFKLKFDNNEKIRPKDETNCICGHKIEENCYLYNKKTKMFLVIGNHCIKKFELDSRRRCKYCNEPHANIKNDICNDCRLLRCPKCKEKKNNMRFKYCYDCYIKYD